MRFDLPQCLERKDAASRLCEIDKSALDTLLKIERERVASVLAPPQPTPGPDGFYGEALAFGVGVVVGALALYAAQEALRVRD